MSCWSGSIAHIGVAYLILYNVRSIAHIGVAYIHKLNIYYYIKFQDNLVVRFNFHFSILTLL